jgi:hypothetical protein
MAPPFFAHVRRSMIEHPNRGGTIGRANRFSIAPPIGGAENRGESDVGRATDVYQEYGAGRAGRDMRRLKLEAMELVSPGFCRRAGSPRGAMT